MRVARRLVVVPVALALVAGALSGCARLTGAGVPFREDDGQGTRSADVEPSVVMIADMGTLTVTAPMTILDVRPHRLTGPARLVAMRVQFHGTPSFAKTPGGYYMYQGGAGSHCTTLPLTGYGPTYPAQGMALKPGDFPKFVIWLYGNQIGETVATGFTVTYRSRGRKGTYTSDSQRLVMRVVPRGAARPCPHGGFNQPDPRGFPTDTPPPLVR